MQGHGNTLKSREDNVNGSKKGHYAPICMLLICECNGQNQTNHEKCWATSKKISSNIST